ncbi:hypothetical protein, partial [Bacteroides rodentium]
MSKAHERFHDVIILCDKQRLAFVCIGYESGTCQLGHQCLTTQTPDFVKVRLLPLKQHGQGNFSLPASYSPLSAPSVLFFITLCSLAPRPLGTPPP